MNSVEIEILQNERFKMQENQIVQNTINAITNQAMHQVTITYCTQCRWLLRAAWIAQELLTTFETDLKAVSLQPGSGGVFEVRLNEIIIFNRKDHDRFPESKELKQLIRDIIAPARHLGHSEKTI